MSKKTSKSHLPNDALTPTEGTAYGLDGYYHDMDYGAGAEEHGRLPSVRGVANLPAGLVANPVSSDQDEDILDDTDTLGDLSNVLAESIPDLRWLEVHEQDMDRLPKDPTNMMVPELEEAWTKYRSKGAFHLSAENQDIDTLRYRESVNNPTPAERTSPEQFGKVLARAARRSAAGDAFSDILRQAKIELGEDLHRVASELKTLEVEHPLAGRVFVRAAAYPGCSSGKWTKQVTKKAIDAKYAVKARKCAGCVYAQKGTCTIFQKKLVASVPWEEARKAYTPRLRAEGRPVEASGDPKAALLAAFSAKAAGPRISKTSFPVKPQVEVLSNKEARKRLAEATPPEKLDLGRQRKRAEKAKVKKTLQKWVKAGLLGQNQSDTLLNSGEAPERILHLASYLAKQATQKKASYTGIGNMPQRRSYMDASQSTRASSEKVSKALVDKVTRNVRNLIAANLVPKDKAEQLLAMRLSPGQTQRIANNLTRLHQKPNTYEGSGEGVMPFVDTNDAEAYQKLAEVGPSLAPLPARKKASEYAGAGFTSRIEKSDNDAFEALRKAASKPTKITKKASAQVGDLFETLQAHDSRQASVDRSIAEFELTNSVTENFDLAEEPQHEDLPDFTFGGMVIED